MTRYDVDLKPPEVKQLQQTFMDSPYSVAPSVYLLRTQQVYLNGVSVMSFSAGHVTVYWGVLEGFPRVLQDNFRGRMRSIPGLEEIVGPKYGKLRSL